jgi:hypothetical protein
MNPPSTSGILATVIAAVDGSRRFSRLLLLRLGLLDGACVVLEIVLDRVFKFYRLGRSAGEQDPKKSGPHGGPLESDLGSQRPLFVGQSARIDDALVALGLLDALEFGEDLLAIDRLHFTSKDGEDEGVVETELVH